MRLIKITTYLFFFSIVFFGLASSAQASDYYAEGTMQSENLLSGATVTDITGFDVTATVPANTTVSIQFSQDRVNFYSSNGTAFGWDSCANGSTVIDISGLSWSGGILFYKLKLTTTDVNATPVVSEVELTYIGGAVPAPGNPHFAEGTVVSTDLLTEKGDTLSGSDYFGYAIFSLPIGTNVYAQFSIDGINFYNSSGTIWEWDTLSFGDYLSPETALSLSSLNWKGQPSFYYKLKFTSIVDNKTTPIVKKAGLLKFTAEMGITGTKEAEPIAYYNFNEGFGDMAHDESGNGNNGTLTPGIGGINTTVSSMWDKNGKIGGAMEFDGVDDYLNLGDIDILNMNLSDWTISAWIKTVSNKSTVLVSKADVSDEGHYRGWAVGILYPGYLLGAFGNGDTSIQTQKSGKLINDDTWHHVTVSFDRDGYIKKYVDGKLDGINFDISAGSTVNINYAIDARIGSMHNVPAYNFNGKIDEVKIYNYALTEDEVKQEYNGGSAISMGGGMATADNNGATVTGAAIKYCVPGDSAKCDAPVLELAMDEKDGMMVYDSSGNGIHGTLIGGPSWTQGKHGSALSFDGSGKKMTIVSPVGQVSYITASLWYKRSEKDSSATYRTLLGHSTANIHPLIIHSSSRNLGIWDGSFRSFLYEPLNDNKWHKYDVIYNSGVDATLYVDGVYKNKITTTLNLSTNPIESIGNWNSGNYWSGFIDHVQVYNYARTPAQIAWDYNRGKSIAHWKMNEGQGTTVHDESGNGNHGTMVNMNSTIAWVDGKNGKALEFDGVNDYVDIGDTGYNINAISFWLKQNATNANIIDLDGGVHTVTLSNSAITATGFSSPTIYIDGKNSSTLPDNAWHHILITTATAIDINNLGIGRIGTSYFTGQIDDVQIFNYALTTEQVKNVYNGGAMRFE